MDKVWWLSYFLPLKFRSCCYSLFKCWYNVVSHGINTVANWVTVNVSLSQNLRFFYFHGKYNWLKWQKNNFLQIAVWLVSQKSEWQRSIKCIVVAWKIRLVILQEKLQVKMSEKAEKKTFLPKCPCCKTGNLHRIAVFDQRGSPAWYLGGSQNTIPCKSWIMGKGIYAQKWRKTLENHLDLTGQKKRLTCLLLFSL